MTVSSGLLAVLWFLILLRKGIKSMNLSRLKKWLITLLCLTVSLSPFMISAVVYPESSSNAWDWESSAPWSIRTQTDSSRLSNSAFSVATSPEWVKYASGTYTPQSYDTDDYYSPNNMRLSCVVGGVWNAEDAEKLDVRVEIYDQNGGRIFYSDWTTNAILNVPIPRRTSYTYNIYVRRYGMQENFVVYATLVWTYEMYYRDEVVTQPTQAPFTLPPDWTNDTTAVATYDTDVIPTYTTAVNIEDVTISDYDISENTSFMSAILSTLQGFSYTYNLIAGALPYWWSIVVGLALVALIAWLLH